MRVSIVDAGDVILRVTATAICGSDLHLYNALMSTMDDGDIDLSEIISHRLPLKEAPAAYKMFQEKRDKCIKVVMTP